MSQALFLGTSPYKAATTTPATPSSCATPSAASVGPANEPDDTSEAGPEADELAADALSLPLVAADPDEDSVVLALPLPDADADDPVAAAVPLLGEDVLLEPPTEPPQNLLANSMVAVRVVCMRQFESLKNGGARTRVPRTEGRARGDSRVLPCWSASLQPPGAAMQVWTSERKLWALQMQVALVA